MNWGIEGYNVPKISYNHEKIKAEKENMLYAIGKKKRKFKKLTKEEKEAQKKKANSLTYSEKYYQNLPSPWNYDVSLRWHTGYKIIGEQEKVGKIGLKIKQKWLTSDKYSRPKPEKGKVIQAKDKKKFTKKTFIDQIVTINTKKNYPLPGPGSEHIDEKIVEKLHKDVENKAIFKIPEVKIQKTKPLTKYIILYFNN